MALLHSIFSWVIKKRIHQIDLFIKYPIEVQKELFNSLINTGRGTEWGNKYDYKSIQSYNDFKNRVPVNNYESIFPYINRMMMGESNILWPSKIEWFSKSSGTTNAKSKFIPVSPEALENCHYKAGKDMLSLYVNNFENYNLFSGKTISIGGTHQAFSENPSVSFGDVSAVITENLPLWAQAIRSPSKKTALLSNWDDKLEKMMEETITKNITSLTGVPTWALILLQKTLERTGKNDITEIWPNLELFVHGGVSFEPYKDIFNELIPHSKMNYMETYTASEGFFGIQDIPDSGDMLLMLDYGIFYEFMPMEEYGKDFPNTITLEDVELDTIYALVITTNAGLWRYLIGDTIRFTSLNPFRFKITGRTKHFMNAFGEELIIENAENAVIYACKETGASIKDYSAGPIYLTDKSGGHEWLMEFTKEPNDLEKFTYFLDKHLRECNSDYDSKRYQDIALAMPIVKKLPKGTFYKWMESRGKLGAQHKVPRLANDREYIDSILKMI